MTTQLDEISEAIGQLRAAQLGTNSNITRLEQRLEGAISVLRDSFERNIQELRNRHHEHNNNIMAVLGKVNQDMKDMQDKFDEKLKPYDVRLTILEQASQIDLSIRRVHGRWVAFLASLVAAAATGTIEGLIWLFGGHGK